MIEILWLILKVLILLSIALVYTNNCKGQMLSAPGNYNPYNIGTTYGARDTAWIKFGSDSLFGRNMETGVMEFKGIANPVRRTPIDVIIGFPSYLKDSTILGPLFTQSNVVKQYKNGYNKNATLLTDSVNEGNNLYFTNSRARTAISLTNTSGAVSYNSSTGVINIPTANDYTNTVNTVGDSAVFYLTSDKTLSGTALFTTTPYINPVVNNVNGNYTFGWTLSADKKTLVVKSRVATNTAVIALLGISVLGSTQPVTTGTPIQIFAK